MTTGPVPAPLKCKSGWFNVWGHSSMHRMTRWRWWSGRPHHATSHLWSQLETQHQSVPWCAEECDDPLVQSGGRWQTLGVGAGLGACPQVQWDPDFRRSAATLYPSLTGPLPSLTWTHWTTSFDYTSRISPTWLPTTPKPAWLLPFAEYSPSIRRALASACGKGILPVPDLYRGGHWGWRWLHWIDVSSIT